MNYLVLKPIKAFGKRYERGAIIEASDVRCAKILVGEHKITPIKAISSSIMPEEEATAASEQVKEDKKPVKLSFSKKEG